MAANFRRARDPREKEKRVKQKPPHFVEPVLGSNILSTIQFLL